MCYQLTSIHLWFSNALSMSFPAKNGHRKIAELQLIPSDKITLYEMINEPRLKTEPYVTLRAFFLSKFLTSNQR